MAAVPTMVKDVKKLSFARVAAGSTSKDSASITAVMRTTGAAPAKERREQAAVAPIPANAAAPIVSSVPVLTPASGNSMATPKTTSDPDSQVTEANLVSGLKELKLETRTPNLVVNGSLSGTTDRSSKTGVSQTPSDDTSQRADSSSDLGTKPPSLDGKSITSGTTFALDEKESLRPDDSASVKAAAEDDDAFSIRGSYMTGSRMGSEVAARIHRIQLGDMPPRTLTTHHVLPGSHSQGVTTPQSGISDKQPATDAKLPLVSGMAAPDALTASGFPSQNPDDKLLEAMQSPKDRIFLLRLEQQVIDFVQGSDAPFMDLPPSNSFCRMLTHKLADYYHMTHSFEAVAGAVRIYRTPFCRIPASLSSIAASTSSSSSPAPQVQPRKIMRRGEDGEFPGSTNPSKPASEVDSDSKDKAAPANQKLTREEREEAYNRARQRIFGSVEKAENSNPDGEDGNGVSRASSVSAKDRANAGSKRKTKQRRDDESFESRSQYVAHWGGPQHTTWAPVAPQYFPVGASPYNGQYQQAYPSPVPVQPMYGPSQPYPPQMMPAAGFNTPYNGIATYPTPPVPQAGPPPPQQRFQPPNPPMAVPYSAPAPSVPQPTWPQQGYNSPSAYPGRGSPAPAPAGLPAVMPAGPPAVVPPGMPASMPAGMSPSMTPGIPYAYGQLPANAHPNDPKSQHPIPGSYNRQAFNPKTQSFVPANGMVPMAPPPAPPAGPYGGPGSHHGSPRFNSPHMSYAGFQQPLPQPGYGVPVPGSYGMSRQGSSNSMAHYHPPPQPQPHPAQHVPHHMPPTGPSAHKGHAPPPQGFSHLPNYGNPATLPQKPST